MGDMVDKAVAVMEVAAAEAILISVRGKMDDYAREIFDLWLDGTAAPEVNLDSQKWASYMQADVGLTGQIQQQLKIYAELIGPEVQKNQGQLARSFQHSFHAEVGGSDGGYFTGYDILHGTDRTVGDFEVSGKLTTAYSSPKATGYTVTYSELTMVFNDIVNANRKYGMDISGERLAKNICKVLKKGPPRDYTLRIRWTQTQPVTVSVSGFLKQFPNL